MMLKADVNWWQSLVDQAIAEDIGDGDASTLAVVPADLVWSARLMAREPLVVCGLPVAADVFRKLDPDVQFRPLAMEGDKLMAGSPIAEVHGLARGLLTAERVALNFMQHLSGIATLTRKYVDAVEGTHARILDTRKTTPGWRMLEKYAVAAGGADNHRIGLFDAIMIKDNHLAALADEPDPISTGIRRARAAYPNLTVEVEVDTVEQARLASEAGADFILLDNMSPDMIRVALSIISGRSKTEASGGITLKTVRAVAETGVDYISIGALTHSAPSVDVALDFEAL